MAQLKHHPGFELRDDAAHQFDRAEDDHGLFTVTSAKRTEAAQQILINRWDQGGVFNRPPYLYAPARPAASSPHVKDGGIAIDLGNWQSFLQICKPYGFTHPIPSDLVHFEFHGVAGAPIPPVASGSNPFGIGDIRGLQKISNIYGGGTAIDNAWGPKSAKGFSQFLRTHYQYVGNNVLGPVMWAAIARWLRARWGYKGNDVPGPIMRAFLQKASDANFAQL